MEKVHQSIFARIVSPENLFSAWEEFKKGKRFRPDVMEFEQRLEPAIFQLQRELAARSYRHGPYSAFRICDPKQRQIHKASVRDRIVHHAVFSVLNPIFESGFIAHSFSCRVGKGTHKAVDALERMLRRVSRNHTRPCFALKCDVHQFFASVDHEILLRLLGKRIKDERAMRLLAEIVGSFQPSEWKGIPIGNLTSQLFANVYLNELDQFMKHELKIQHYVRYTDDFVVVSPEDRFLQDLLPSIRSFFESRLNLALHPRKVTIRKSGQGVDFLGYILLPHHRMLRTKTKRRMFRKMNERIDNFKRGILPEESVEQSLQSYLGVLSHADAFRLGQELRNMWWLRMVE